MNPLSTKEGINAAILQDPRLRFNQDLVRTYQSLGGALSNGGIPLPSGAPQVQQTTTPMRTEAIRGGVKLDEHLARVSGQQNAAQADAAAGAPAQSGATPSTTIPGTPAGATPGQPAAPAAGGFADQRAKVQTDLDKKIASAEGREQSRIAYATTTLDSIAARSDTATKALVDSIKTTYASRIALMQDANKRTLAAKEQKGIRSGRAKYITDLHQGVLSDEENRGLARVGQLEGEMLSLISQAEQARTKQDLEMFNSRMTSLNNAYDDLRSEVQNLQSNAFNQLRIIQDAENAAATREKDEFQRMLDTSERVAPALASALEGLTTADEKAQVVKEYAKKSGIDPEILMGDIEAHATDEQKAKLDIENIKSQIAARDKGLEFEEERVDIAGRQADSSAQQANVAAAREARERRKETFNPTQEERSSVGKYLASKGSDEDLERVKTDQGFFYYILSLAQEEEL